MRHSIGLLTGADTPYDLAVTLGAISHFPGDLYETVMVISAGALMPWS